MTFRAYAASRPSGPLEPFEFDPGPLGPDDVEVAVASCGVCHSDLSMLDNDWRMASYPFVPGHEVVGTIAAVGERVTHLAVGASVGIGWYARSCMTCRDCLAGDHNLCDGAQGVIVGRHGGFADRVRAQAAWVTPLPAGLAAAEAGPLFCGGITVFNPLVQFGVTPMDRVGVVGIGGLGHLALAFLRAWGCHVTAFSTSPDKEEEARRLGAHEFVATRDAGALKRLARSFDLILVTVNVELDWPAYVAALRPKGRLHLVGAAPSVSTAVFPLISEQRSISGSPVGSPGTIARMLEFAARHGIAPVTEHFPMSRVNEALDHLRSGRARYRIVLDADFA